MTENALLKTKGPSQEETEFLPQILVSLIPATAVLIIGAYGSQLVQPEHALLFTFFFLFAAGVTFLGERKVITSMQRAQDQQFIEMTTVCCAFLAGNTDTKVKVRGTNEQSKFAMALNLLLDQNRHLLQPAKTTPPPAQPAKTTPTPLQNNEVELIQAQLMQIINDFAPITNGDLTVKTPVPDNLVGIIADACNSFIEELAQFVKWTRYASRIVATTSQSILDSSITTTKNTENQMHRLSNTTNNIEEIVSFLQHLSNNLHLTLDISKELQRDIYPKLQNTEYASATPVGQLLNELQRQTEVLEDILHATEKTSTLAEALIGDLYTVVQQIYQSSVSAMKTVKRLSELETLAERWHTVASAFTLDEDKNTDAIQQEPWLL